MSSLYDKKENIERLDGGKSFLPNEVSPEESSKTIPQEMVNNQFSSPFPKEDQPLDITPMDLRVYQEQSLNALQMVDDVVLKNYLAVLSKMDVIPAEKSELSTDNVILFKINKMVYEKDEYATDKFISVVSAMTYTESSLFLIVDGHEDQTDFYLGIKCYDPERQYNTTPSRIPYSGSFRELTLSITQRKTLVVSIQSKQVSSRKWRRLAVSVHAWGFLPIRILKENTQMLHSYKA